MGGRTPVLESSFTTSAHRSSPVLQIHEDTGGIPYPFGRGFDVVVTEMGVAQGHAHIAMSEQPGDDGHRHAVQHRMARVGVAQIVKADILDAGFPPHPVPQREMGTARTGRIERRREYETARATRLEFENAPGLGIQRNPSRPRLAVDEEQSVVIDLRPAQPDDLASAATGQQ